MGLCGGDRSETSDWCGDLERLHRAVGKLKKNEKKRNPVLEKSQKIVEEIGRLLEDLLQLDSRRSQPVFKIEIWKKGALEREVQREVERVRERLEEQRKKAISERENVITDLETNIARLQREIKNIEEQRKKAVLVLEKDKANLETHIASFETDNIQLREQIEKVKKERKNLELKIVEEQGKNDDLQKDVNRLQRENNNLEEERKKAASEIENLKQKIDRLEKEVDSASKSFENAKNINKNLLKQLDEKTHEAQKAFEVNAEYARAWEAQNRKLNDLQRNLNEQRNSIDKLQRNLSEEKKAKENALNRLSAAAANRLRDQNPGITDLSDPNRPLKLAEKVSELYDNEWTNAMENLESKFGMKEEKGIKLLLKIIKNVFDTCAEFGDAHLAAFPDMLIIPPAILQTEKERTLNVKELPAEILKPMKDFRKSQAKHAINHLQKYISSDEGKSKLQISEEKFDTCKEYIDKCVELCWMMRIQDPPIYMETNYPTNSEFDSNKMRSYTKAGKFVSFVVWPTFFLHKDGPLLGKGVVQGSKKEVEDIEESSDESEIDEFDDARSRTDSDQKEGSSTDAEKPQQEDDKTTPGASNSQINNTEGNVQKPNPEEPHPKETHPKEPHPKDSHPKETHPKEPNGDKHSDQPEGLVKETTDHEKVKDNGNNSEGAEIKGEIENEEQNDKLINDNEDCGE